MTSPPRDSSPPRVRRPLFSAVFVSLVTGAIVGIVEAFLFFVGRVGTSHHPLGFLELAFEFAFFPPFLASIPLVLVELRAPMRSRSWTRALLGGAATGVLAFGGAVLSEPAWVYFSEMVVHSGSPGKALESASEQGAYALRALTDARWPDSDTPTVSFQFVLEWLLTALPFAVFAAARLRALPFGRQVLISILGSLGMGAAFLIERRLHPMIPDWKWLELVLEPSLLPLACFAAESLERRVAARFRGEPPGDSGPLEATKQA
jgi:hypothetical protein